MFAEKCELVNIYRALGVSIFASLLVAPTSTSTIAIANTTYTRFVVESCSSRKKEGKYKEAKRKRMFAILTINLFEK